MRDVIFTIGYERATVPDFLSTLAEARVGVVADVRAIAHSRRPGFAKTALGLHLVGAGIGYWHLSALGNPKPGREAAWAGDDALFRAIFQAHLRTSVAVEALGQLASRAADERICLLCLEAEPERCHRSLVAAALQAAHGIGVRHLFPALADAGAG